MKQIRRLFLLLCLITAGAQCTWAYYSNYKLDKTVTINNLKYDLFSYYAYEVNGYVHTCVESRHYACLVDILGTNEDVVIPGKIEDNGVEYTVNTIGTLIENNSIKSLTFQGPADFYFSTFSWKTGIDASGNNTYGYQEYSGFIKSTSLQTIEFKAGISEWNFKGARLLCPNLRHVVFTGFTPIFSGTWSNYCTAPASNVTAVVTNWSQETCENKQLTATVWCEFKNVVPSLDLVHDATLKSNGGGDVQIWKNKNNKSQLDYTMSSEGGEELVTFYGNVDSYQIRVYTSSNYNNPVLKRNGTVVNLETGSGYYYYDETSQMSVNSYEVVYNANNSRRLNFLNFGNGTVTLSGVSNGSAVSYEAEGLTETTYTFDKTTPVSVTITPQEGYKVQRIEHYGRIALPFDVNETTGVATTQYIFDDNESEQALKIYYQKKVIDEGTQFKLRISVDGSVGIGSVFYTDDGNYDWYDDDIGDNYFGYEIAPGESEEVIGKYELGDIMVFDFYVVNHLDEEEVAAGFTTMVNVYANGGKVECSDPGTEWGDYYSIPLDGGDMDVRVVIESNGRYLTGDNGSGGRVAIYCEGSETPLRIEDPGYWFWTLIPKTANPYVVITPLTGKTVVAVVRDGKMLSSLSTYRQSDGTYRIPLEGFDKGDSDYPLYVVYGDDISSVPIIEWNLLMVGDVDEANNENPKANVLWMVGGDELLLASEGASLKASCNIDKTWYVPVDTYLDFSLNVKPGQTFKVSFNGTDVTNIFVRKADYDNDDGTLCYVYEARGYEQFATDGTWVVEVKEADLLTQHIQLTGEQLDYFTIQYLVSGGGVLDDVQADNEHHYVTFSSDEKEFIKGLKIYVNVPQGCTFKASFNGEEVTGFTLDGSNYTVTLDETFVTDGTWVVEFKKADDSNYTWKLNVIGEVPEGGYVDLYLDGQTYEVYARPSDSYLTDVIEPWPGGYYPFGGQIIVPNGYTFTLLCNGEDISTDFDYNEAQSYYYMSLTAAQSARFNTDINWVIAFTKIDENDVNCDGEVNISDVTKLVNKVLTNDNPSSNP